MAVTDLIVTIVRHGNTFADGEPPRRIGARTDLPLVPGGIAQAQALGRALADAGVRFDRVLAGPLARTRETAGHILSAYAHPPAIEPTDWLAEIDHGPDEDRQEAAVVARIGAGALTAWDAHAVAPDGWIVDADRRMRAWASLFADAAGHVLVVTSNGAARFALLADPGLSAQAAALPSLKLRTAALGTIARRGGRLSLRGWNIRADEPPFAGAGFVLP